MIRGFRDIHCHFIYGVDDGAQTEADMQAMIDAAYADGTTDLFTTPHVTPGIQRFDWDKFLRHLEEARRYIRQKSYDMQIHTGAEILYNPAITRYAEERELPIMEDSDSVLVEFMPDVPLKELTGCVDLMERCGYIPILAHIERYACMYHGNAFRVRDKYDVRFQVNCGTVLGKQSLLKGREINKWFSERLIDYVASDAHNCTSRPTRMQAAYEALKERYDAGYAAKLTGLKLKVRRPDR